MGVALNAVLSRSMSQAGRFGLGFYVGAVLAFAAVVLFLWGIPNKFGGLFGNLMLGAVYLAIPGASGTAGFAASGLIAGAWRGLAGEIADQPVLWCPERPLLLIGMLAGGGFVALGQAWLDHDWQGRGPGVGWLVVVACALGLLSFAATLVVARRSVRRGAEG